MTECRKSLQSFRATGRPAAGSFGRPRSWPTDTPLRQPETISPPPGRLTDAEWAAIAPLLPCPSRHGRRRTTDLQAVVAAIRHHWHTGTPWRRQPPDFPPWQTVYSYFRLWQKDGTLRRLRGVMGVRSGAALTSHQFRSRIGTNEHRPSNSPFEGGRSGEAVD